MNDKKGKKDLSFRTGLDIVSDRTKLFISYAREDAAFALAMAKDLRKAGGAIWIDQLDIAAGRRWDRAVEQALDECPKLLVILSPAAVSSDHVMDEVHYALDEGKDVIPLLYQDCKVPYRLRRLQRVDMRREVDAVSSRAQRMHVPRGVT